MATKVAPERSGKDLRTYVIRVQPGGRPSISLLGSAGALSVLIPSAPLPATVLAGASWLSAFADRRDLPEGDPPPVVIAPYGEGQPYIALVSVEAE